MYVTNVPNGYDNITSSDQADFDKMTLCDCTNNENNIDIFIPSLLQTRPCGLSF